MRTETTYSNFNLAILNLWIGLCKGVHGLPKYFAERGYRTVWIEREFRNQDEDKVCPEIIIASSPAGHTILVESKSGKNVEPDQLHRYSRICSTDLQRQGQVPADAAAAHDCVVIGQEQHSERLQRGLRASNCEFPLLVAKDTGLALVSNVFVSPELNEQFAPELSFDWGLVPLQFVPINSESSLAEVAEIAIPVLVERMVQREPRVQVDTVCTSVCPSWDSLGPAGKDQLKAKVRELFEDAAKNEFAEFVSFQPGGAGTLRIVKNPLDDEPRLVTAGFQKIRKLQGAMLSRLSSGQIELQL